MKNVFFTPVSTFKKIADSILIDIISLSCTSFSIILLILEKAIAQSPGNSGFFFIAEKAILLIFSMDFIFRILFGRKKYFLTGFGWIDLVALAPVFLVIIEKISIPLMIEMAWIDSLGLFTAPWMMNLARSSRMVRVLRLIRGFNLLSHGNDTHPLGQYISRSNARTAALCLSVIFITAAVFSQIQEKLIRTQIASTWTGIIAGVTHEDMFYYFSSRQDILYLFCGDAVMRRLPDEKIRANFFTYQYITLKATDENTAVISIKKYLRPLILQEIFIILTLCICAAGFFYTAREQNLRQ